MNDKHQYTYPDLCSVEDWLNAKGYTGEAGACHQAMSLIRKLEKYEKLVQFIANDYHELSHDKAQWQRDDWKKRCKKLIEEDNK